MKLGAEVSLFIGLLRAVVLLLGLGAVSLFSRMSPAIDRIISDNVSTLMATEQMLAALAEREDPEASSRFQQALTEVKASMTEEGERALVTDLEASWSAAFEPEANNVLERRRLIQSIQELAALNHASMAEADLEAQRLGTAGAWSVVLLGLLILGFGQLFVARLDARVVEPLVDVTEVVREARAGDRFRRCVVRGDSPPEIRAIAEGLNRLLDDVRARTTEVPSASTKSGVSGASMGSEGRDLA